MIRIDGLYPTLKLGIVAIPTYYIIISLAFCLSILFFIRRTKQKDLSPTTALDLSLIIMIFGFIGARLTSVVFEDFSFYRAHPSQIFAFWNGGYVFLGGFLSATIGVVLLLRLRQQPILTWLDTLAPVCAAGYAMGRLACFLTGCCYGRVCIIDSHLAFQHPTQLYAIVWESLLLWFLLTAEKKWSYFQKSGRLFACWLFFHGCGRILMELFRADYRGPEPLGLSLATWLSFGLIITAIWILNKTQK
jgi:phosphatidylglycerol:prolipoprotein diacylglycerol transferase